MLIIACYNKNILSEVFMTDRDNNRNEGTYGGSKYRLRHERPPKKPMTKKEKITLAVLIVVSIVMVFFAYRIGQLYSSYIERHFFQQYEENSASISQNNTALLSNPERFFIASAGARRFYCRSFYFGGYSPPRPSVGRPDTRRQ